MENTKDNTEYKYSIGTKNEKSLHADLKNWYKMPGDKIESQVDGYIIDIVRQDLLIEIQTQNFSAISKKLNKLVKSHNVRLIHPIAYEKWITVLNPDGEIIRRRKSPKKGNPSNIFNELIRIPNLINEDNFSMEILMVTIDEIRCNDGNGAWRRKGISLIDKKLIEVIDSTHLSSKEDFLKFLPDDLPSPFTNKDIAKSKNTTTKKAQKMSYCLKKMGAIEEVGKRGNELLFNII